MNTAPQLLKGFRDFLPKEKRARDFVMKKIVESFETFGFEPIETPTLEYKETIMGKYGEEADKLVYSFTDRGDRDVAMRYDQTVPTARVMASYQNDLPLPFRRYQTQNVFRADKPQKGRFREFTQCDIDIFGSTDPIADAEVLAGTYAAYKNIGFTKVELLVNDRKVLIDTLLPFATESVSVFSIIQSIDKLDKQSASEVTAELVSKGLQESQSKEALETIQTAQPSENLQQILDLTVSLGVPREFLIFSPLTARGLDYYTGMIFEVRIPGFSVGSVAGGGRYDNLINDLCGVQMPAVGMAIGFDRTVEAAQDLGILNETLSGTKVLVTIFDESLANESATIASQLRRSGVSTELYPKFAKLEKQLKYADKKGIPYVLVIGSQEQEAGQVLCKNLQTGDQSVVSRDELASLFI